jgi:hypothetical protein
MIPIDLHAHPMKAKMLNSVDSADGVLISDRCIKAELEAQMQLSLDLNQLPGNDRCQKRSAAALVKQRICLFFKKFSFVSSVVPVNLVNIRFQQVFKRIPSVLLRPHRNSARCFTLFTFNNYHAGRLKPDRAPPENSFAANQD